MKKLRGRGDDAGIARNSFRLEREVFLPTIEIQPGQVGSGRGAGRRTPAGDA
jgi:hypothetical protein